MIESEKNELFDFLFSDDYIKSNPYTWPVRLLVSKFKPWLLDPCIICVAPGRNLEASRDQNKLGI